ncbi:MAG: glycine cleavage system protein GcvH [Myxococcota bacterium]
MSEDILDDRRYTKDHEWAQVVDGEIRIGITAYAVQQLGDITLVNIDVAAGEEVEAGKGFGTVESVKTLADLFAPIAGTVARVNEALEEQPELVNDDCYGAAWMIAIEGDEAALADLMVASDYEKLLSEQD